MKKNFRVLALDPGSTNFGFSLLEVNNGKLRLVACGLLDKTMLVHSLNEQTLSAATATFKAAFEKLVRSTRADCISAERYLIQRRGTTGESVNMMLALMSVCGKPMQIFMAATWKAKLKKHLGCKLEEVYKITHSGGKLVPDHAIDATMQGMFFCERELGVPLKWDKNVISAKVTQTFIGIWPRGHK